jgi:hypothetical protein
MKLRRFRRRLLPVIFIDDEFGIFIPHEGAGILYRPIGIGFEKVRIDFIETALFFLGEEANGVFNLKENNKRNIVTIKKIIIDYTLIQ